MSRTLCWKNSKGEFSYPVSSFFLNGIVVNATNPQYEEKLSGLNVGIALPHDSEESYDNFVKDFYCDKVCGFYKVFVKDEETSIPVIVHGGNGYDKYYGGSSCLFGYICPEFFDARPLPII